VQIKMQPQNAEYFDCFGQHDDEWYKKYTGRPLQERRSARIIFTSRLDIKANEDNIKVVHLEQRICVTIRKH
jgi:hypothetical protein